MKKETYNSLVGKIEILSKLINGGDGSGNFGHSGRPGKVGGSSQSGGFSKGQSVEFEYGGGKGTGKIVRKLTDKEKKDRAFLANPDAGDYYEVEKEDGHKTIVWDAKIKPSKDAKTKPSKDAKIKPSESKYIRKMSEYVKSRGKTSVDMTKSWSVEDAAKKYLDKANVSVEDFDDIYSLKVDYKDYSSSTPISKKSKEEFKKDFSKAIVESQEQIFGQDSSSALVSTSESRKYTEEVISKIQKELDIK